MGREESIMTMRISDREDGFRIFAAHLADLSKLTMSKLTMFLAHY